MMNTLKTFVLLFALGLVVAVTGGCTVPQPVTPTVTSMNMVERVVDPLEEGANGHNTVYKVVRRTVSQDFARPVCIINVQQVDVEQSGKYALMDAKQLEFRKLTLSNQPFWALREGDYFIVQDQAPLLVDVVRKDSAVHLKRRAVQLVTLQ